VAGALGAVFVAGAGFVPSTNNLALE
jgi:hypothetical protein